MENEGSASIWRGCFFCRSAPSYEIPKRPRREQAERALFCREKLPGIARESGNARVVDAVLRLLAAQRVSCKIMGMVTEIAVLPVCAFGHTAITVKESAFDEIHILWQEDGYPLVQTLNGLLADTMALTICQRKQWNCLILESRDGAVEIESVALALAKVMAGTVQPHMIARMIAHVLPQLSAQEQRTLCVLSTARAGQKGMSENDGVYLATLQRRIAECLSLQGELHIEGFVSFRMRDFVDSWAQCVEEVARYAVARYEYGAYVELLQAFLQRQRNRVKCATVRQIASGGYWVESEQGRQCIRPHAGQSCEEALLCTLLLLAPETVHLYCAEKLTHSAVMETILRLFENAVEVSLIDD